MDMDCFLFFGALVVFIRLALLFCFDLFCI